MKSKTSFFSKNLFYNDLKVYGWFGIVYTLFLFLLMPLTALLSYDGKGYNYYYIKDILEFEHFFINIGLLVLPVLAAILLFRYLQVVRSYTTLHSLPFTRTQTFNSHILAGLVVLIAPLLLNVVLAFTINFIYGSTIESIDFLYWFLKSTLLSATIFLISSFIGVIVGSSIWHFVFSYIFLLLPYGLLVMIFYLLDVLVFGFSSNYLSHYEYLSPLLIGEIDSKAIITYVIYCIIFYPSSLYLYNKRHLENASSIISFNVFKGIFKYGVTFCFMLFIGLIYGFGFSSSNSAGKFIIGAVIGTVIGYFISEMLLQKKWNVFHKYKGLMVYTLVMLLFFLGLKYDVIGYERKIPASDDVEYIVMEGYYGYRYFFNESYTNNYQTTDNINTIINLHSQVVKDRERGGSFLFIQYHLKNGKTITRSYEIDAENYDSYFGPIYESLESKRNHYALLRRHEEDIYNVVINPNNAKEPIVIKDPIELNEFIQFAKQDILDEQFESMKESLTLATLRFNGTDDEGKNFTADAQIKDSYNNIVIWLKSRGYYNDIAVLPEDVKRMVVVNEEEYDHSRKIEDIFNDTGEYDYLYIDDKKQIEQILNSKTENYDARYNNIIVYFQYEEYANIGHIYIDEDKVPQFIKNWK